MSTATQERTATRLQVETLASHFPRFAKQFGNRSICLVRADMRYSSGAFKEYGVDQLVRNLKRAGHDTVTTTSMGSQALAVVSAGARYGMRVGLSVTQTLPDSKETRMHEIWQKSGRNPEELMIYKNGQTFTDAQAFGDEHFDPTTHIHPFNDRCLIDYRQQIFWDALRSQPELSHLVVPIGGASLFASQVLAARGTDVHVYASQAPGSNSMSKSLAAGTIVSADAPDIRFGGTAVDRVGDIPFHDVWQEPDIAGRIVTAESETVINLAREYSRHTPEVPMEPTSLVAVAGLEKIMSRTPLQEVIGVIVTGHNEPYTNLLTS